MQIFPSFPKFLEQPNFFFMASNNFGNALIRKKILYTYVLGILPSAYVRWFEVDENGWHCESRSF